jgi:hypothetical protein
MLAGRDWTHEAESALLILCFVVARECIAKPLGLFPIEPVRAEATSVQSTVATLVAQHEIDTVKLDTQAARIASLEQQLAGIQTALANLQPKDQRLAQR